MLNADRDRDETLRSMGLTVLRFTNVDIFKNIEGVVIRIIESLE
jgi:very-short-patch-repair endonuclease